MSLVTPRAAPAAATDTVAELIAARPVFRGCGAEDIAALARLAHFETHEDEAGVDREVDESREMLIIWQGENRRLVLPIDAVIELAEHRRSLAPAMAPLARLLAGRLHGARTSAKESLAHALELAHTRVVMGKFILLLIVTYSLYVWFLGTAKQVTEILGRSELVTISIAAAVAAVVFHFMRTTGYPPSFFGLTLRNWRHHTAEAVILTLPLMLATVLLKIALVRWVPAMHDEPIFQMFSSFHGDAASVFNPWLFLGYITFAPLQELIHRGSVQGGLEHFFVGPNRRWAAILCSNVVFSAGHLYISPGLSLLSFVAGIFWGWLYSRQRGLVGVSVSHVLLGFWAFEVVDLGVLE